MNAKSVIRAGLLGAALLVAPVLAQASVSAPLAAAADGDGAARPARSCFSLSDWQGWSAPDKNTLYMKVRNRDVYRVDLSHGTNLMTSPGVHLVSIVRGTDQICTPIDLDLRVSDGFGFAMPIMAKSITRLTPEEIAAIPKRDRP